MASDKLQKCCLVCSTPISIEQNTVEKLDILFLLQILLEIPPEHQLISSIKSSLNLLQLCDQCISTVYHCKQIYTEISEKIEKFWETQNNLLNNFNANPDFPKIGSGDESNTWATQCRKFVQYHDFSGFGYPFVIQDLETLLTSDHKTPSLPQKLPPGVTCTVASESSSFKDSIPNDYSQNWNAKLRTNVTCTLTGEKTSIIGISNDNDDSQNENSSLKTNKILYPSPNNVTISIVQDNNDNSNICEDNEIYENSSDELSENNESELDESYQPKMIRIIIAPSSDSKKRTYDHNRLNSLSDQHKNEYNFAQDPATKKFLCLEPSCLKSSVSKQYITNHYERDHLKIREKESFPCEWPECGKIIGDKQTWKEHMDKHKGTPSYECENCGNKFYYRKKLANHKKREHGNETVKYRADKKEIILIKEPKRQVVEREPVRQTRKRKHIQELVVNQEIYRCEVRECKGRRFKDGIRLQAHMDQHNGTPREICGKCGHRFYYRFHLDEHQQQCEHS